jgi:hypothetical protein
MPLSTLAVVPLLSTDELSRLNPARVNPLIPKCVLFCTTILDRLTVPVLVKLMAFAVAFWIVPPLPAEPFPVTINPPLAPVVLRIIPLAGPLPTVPAVILRNVRPLAPMVVFATLSAVPVVVVSVFTVVVLF